MPRGVDPESAIVGYVEALQGATVEAITHGIRRFLRGECKDVSQKFCPHPPELATIVRKTVHAPSKAGTDRPVYRYRPPNSRVLERSCTREWAFGLIDNGVHPRSSIWCPGSLNDKPEVGDLYGPDPVWKPAVLVA